MPAKAQIRRARFDGAPLLTELTMRSKLFWRYDASFLADARQELEFQPNKFLPDFHVYILEEDGQMLGFCSLIPIEHETIKLHDLFIEPSHIGKGYGKLLWGHSVNAARELGIRTLVLTADPNAEPFYARQGAVRTAEKTSSVRCAY
jgi:N-acetylglutamate synthase-like GNAT family acetyltransferase